MWPQQPPLPSVPGPKLSPFTPDAYADVTFLEDLGDAKDKDGHVWKVEIQNRGIFALKLFPFIHWKTLSDEQAISLARPLQTKQQYIDYFDPFSAECRVYGRLRQEDREDLAVRALGYLFLTPEQEAEVTRRVIGDSDWEGNSDEETKPDVGQVSRGGLGHPVWGRRKHDRNKPIRAIVKEFVKSKSHFKPHQAAQMWQDFEDLESLGILVRDIHLRNYIDGKLVDFGRSWTMFHPCFDQIRAYTLQRERDEDIGDLYDLITDDRDEEDIRKELRSPKRFDEAVNGGATRPPVRQLEYEWWKWEDSPEAAEDYLLSGLYAEEEPGENDDDDQAPR